jgi:predicted metal-dependent hydrolase
MKGLLGKLFATKISAAPLPLTIEADGQAIAITLKKHTRARRMTLRMGRDGRTATMTVPPRATRKEAEAFALRSTSWIAKQLARRQPDVHVADGASIMLRAKQYRLEATGSSRGHVQVDHHSSVIRIPGRAEHMPRRLKEWLKTQAHIDLTESSTRYATAMGVKFRRITVRDQKSRWGSCTSNGDLSYSWRLVLAPDFVLDYVAAHEVAHLKEMNHGPKFWRLVLTHCKNTRAAKTWLKQNGSELHTVLPS